VTPNRHEVSAPVTARSVSRRVMDELGERPRSARVLAVFARACNLVTDDGRVIALVLPPVGDGPLNVVVEPDPDIFAALEPGLQAQVDRTRLGAGDLEVDLGSASCWDPRPEWERLRTQRTTLVDRCAGLYALGLRYAPEGSLWSLIPNHPAASGRALRPTTAATFWEAAKSLQAGWQGNESQLGAGARRLAGLGAGLTPAGDDFLAGVMLCAWLTHPAPRRLCHQLVETAAPRTTTLAAAFLRAAADGECSVAWHRLLAALGDGCELRLAAAVQDVLAHGATSGADMLAGFLWMPHWARLV
jgi:hypothetical protein